MLNRDHHRGLILWGGLILAATLATGLWTGFIEAGRAVTKGRFLIIGVAGAAARPGLYVLKPGQGSRELARLAGFEPGLIRPDQLLATGQRVVIRDQGVDFEELAQAHRRLAGLKINLNRAKAGDLTLLPGIGSSRARAIIRTREKLGRFNDLKDLEAVPGLGPRRINSLAGKIEF